MLVGKRRIFLFYKHYVWVLNIDSEVRERSEYVKPLILRHWLPFLPTNFTEISGIYQKPNGQIAIFIDKSVYYIHYPSLRYAGKDSMNSVFGRDVRINAVLNTNHGKTFAFVDNWMVVEINECTNKAVILGSTSNTFPGVPEKKLIGGFRYKNGRLYFITDSSVLEYDEYTESVTQSITDLFKVLVITCIGEGIINQLYGVIKYLNG